MSVALCLPPPPPCLAEPTLFSSLLYLLKKVQGVLFLLCIQIKEGDVIYLFNLLKAREGQGGTKEH